MKPVSLIIPKEIKDKFSYHINIRKKSKSIISKKNLINDKLYHNKENENLDDFWSDCKD